MSLIVNHNLSAMQTHRNLAISNSHMTKSIEKLSSGYKINVGADDPSGLIISEQLRSQISGLNRAIRNSSEASNLIGIAEGALNEMNEILKKMRALSIHAANNGVTSPEQVAADQSEMDSGIQTIERIANTTRYSDQYLLNGSKQLVYDVATIVDQPNDHPLINTEMTRVDQVFKREGVKMSIGFTGERSRWQANSDTSAQRAYLETDNANALCELDGDKVTAKQEFILTGTKGSRLFSFAAGTSLGTMVDGVNNVKDSTGIGATLTFASDVRIDLTSVGVVTPPDYNTLPPTPAVPIIGYDDNTYVYAKGDVQIYGAGLNNVSTSSIMNFALTPDAAASFRVGYNCDGDGKIYAKVIDESNGSLEYFKDRECTMLIGRGDGNSFSAANNSGIPGSPTLNLDGIFINLTDKAKNLDVYEIAVIGQDTDNMKDMAVNGLQGWTDINTSTMSGVDLGRNTSSDGSIFFKYTPLTFNATGSAASYKVEAFKHFSMEPQYLVGSSGSVNVAPPAAVADDTRTVRIESVEMEDGTQSNLNMTLNLHNPDATKIPFATGSQAGSIKFTNLGMRMYTSDYGSQETLRIQNKTGSLFYHYREPDTMEKVMVTGATTVQLAGQDAQIGLNGAPILTTGLVANTTTPDFAGSIVFNSGSLGLTTIAVTGHESGSIFARSTSIPAIEENEINIAQERRFFEPPSLLYGAPATAATGLRDQFGGAVNLYLDFSQLDPTVEAAIDIPTAAPLPVNIQYNPPATLSAQGTITIDATPLGVDSVITLNIDPEQLANGFYVTNPVLKGLFIKSTAVPTPLTTDPAGPSLALQTQPFGGSELMEVNTYATNPRKNTTEDLFNFLGGMQFQLGNTEGDQDRTVYSIQSMVMANIGRMEWNGNEYCLQDVLGGGVASLSRDPIMAMRIVGQAIDDVTTLRARLGAFQKNMLETNINALSVAVENITKTEAAIRDTDMAEESTEFTKNQVMVNAGTSMLAQANQVTQNVLQLLGG